jgi:o-succinylbenzoate synthase
LRHEFIPYAIAFRRPVATAAGVWAVRRGAWLRVEAEDGLAGLGEVAPLGPLASAEALAAAIGSGPCREAAFDLALLDLDAQRAGQSIAAFLGGASRERVAVNALLFSDDAASIADEAAVAVAAGFRTLKLKVASASPEADIARILAVRERAGPGVEIRLDANGGWDEPTALRVLGAVAHCGIEFVEDPVAGDPGAVRRRLGVPVALDARTLEEGWRAVRERGADVLVLKPMALGGVRATRELACKAIDAGLGVIVTSVFDTAVGIAGALHLAASLPGPARAHGLATAALLEETPIEGLDPAHAGGMQVPRGHGLGVHLRDCAP